MNPNLLCRIGIVSFSCLLPLRAGESDLREMLRDALYTEEVSREPDKAAKQYEELLSRHDEQKAYAASALFRLAEVRRKQDRKDDAIALYQRLLTEFPNAAAETKLARENLTALGGKLPEAGAVAVDEEEKEIQRLTKLLESSPDLVNQDELDIAVRNGRIRVVTWLIQAAKVDVVGSEVLENAAESGHLRMVECLMALKGGALKDHLPGAMISAIHSGYLEVVRALLRLGASSEAAVQPASMDLINGSNLQIRGGRPLIFALVESQFKIADLLIDAKADVKAPDGDSGITPLYAAAANSDPGAAKYVEKLIDLGADVNAVVKVNDVMPNSANAKKPDPASYGPLQFAIHNRAWPCADALIRRGADLKNPDMFRFVQCTIRSEDDLKAIKFLIQAGASPERPVRDGTTLLAWAVERLDNDLIKLLLAKGANPNVKLDWNSNYSPEKPTLLQHVALGGQLEVLKLLLDGGGDPTVPPFGKTLLKIISNKDDETTLSFTKLLVEKGALPDDEWKKQGYDPNKPKTRAFLMEKFSKPEPATENK